MTLHTATPHDVRARPSSCLRLRDWQIVGPGAVAYVAGACPTSAPERDSASGTYLQQA